MKNWEKISEFSSRGLMGVSYRSKSAKIDSYFDVGIFFGTFESRGLVSSNLLNRRNCKKSIIVLFDEAKDTMLRKK
ncbi:MAG: hypothetical protein PHD31_03015, partial [Candidatus Pacebacteria bacterium]|nr:hypothetical protein [Candidatus Paceibacterota bacterium]